MVGKHGAVPSLMPILEASPAVSKFYSAAFGYNESICTNKSLSIIEEDLDFIVQARIAQRIGRRYLSLSSLSLSLSLSVSLSVKHMDTL